MSLQSRVAVCDVCRQHQEEENPNGGWPGWAIIQGIGAKAPEEGASIQLENTQLYLCSHCREEVSHFINGMQRRF